MKMGFLFSGMFWGGVLVLLGISIIIKVAFHIDIPVFKIVVGLVLIYLGARLLWTSFGGCRWASYSVRCEKTASQDGNYRSYKNVFGEEDVDLTDVTVKNSDVVVDIETVFGSTEVRIDPSVPTEFSVDAVFGNASIPGLPGVNFGSRVLGNKALKEGKPRLKIRAKVVFGNIEFVESGRGR